jgi:hypothetical protein
MWVINPTLPPFPESQYRFPDLSGMVSNIVTYDLPIRSLVKVWTPSDVGDMPGKAGFYRTEDVCTMYYFFSDRVMAAVLSPRICRNTNLNSFNLL